MSYAGDISCLECWKVLQEEPDSQLIDVRTTAEWNFVGFPHLTTVNKQVMLVEWQVYSSMQVNPDFVAVADQNLEQAGASKESLVFMLCRSGVRSISAAQALTVAGYKNVYNVLDGFEGNPDENGHRGNLTGWKFDRLPWQQR
ncbi:MAG: rhodanese-like domain-containing protein [Pseudomonadota bacterium]